MSMSKRVSAPLLAAVLLLSTAACGDDPVAPGIEPQVINNTDAFSYQVSDLAGVSGTYTYTWQNTGTLAKITHASDAGGTGSATVTITDADGTEVYSGAFATTGEATSSPAGTAGAWTITVTYASYTNTQVNFAVIME